MTLAKLNVGCSRSILSIGPTAKRDGLHVSLCHAFVLFLQCCQVNIGIIDANPSSTAGVISIMAHLHRHVPHLDNDSLIVIPTHGDCVAVERMVDAQRARAADLSSGERLLGLEPIPQEFHHRALMLQVSLRMHVPQNAEIFYM